MNARRDAGLHAVARVRSVRETDSRIGLQTALAEQRAAQAKVDEVRDRIERTGTFETGTAESFLALRRCTEVLGAVLVAAQGDRDQAGTISEAALGQWRHDRARLDAIEMLLERRAAARRTEGARREARELDDIAGQRWLRAREQVQAP